MQISPLGLRLTPLPVSSPASVAKPATLFQRGFFPFTIPNRTAHDALRFGPGVPVWVPRMPPPKNDTPQPDTQEPLYIGDDIDPTIRDRWEQEHAPKPKAPERGVVNIGSDQIDGNNADLTVDFNYI